MAYTLNDPAAPTRKQRQYFEMFAHRAIWADGWKAVTMHPSRLAATRIPDPCLKVRMGRFEEDEWELHHLAEDFSESHNLADQYPEKLAELQELWWEDAWKFNVLPLEDRSSERRFEPKPRVLQEREVYTFTAPVRLGRSVSPSVIDRDRLQVGNRSAADLQGCGVDIASILGTEKEHGIGDILGLDLTF